MRSLDEFMNDNYHEEMTIFYKNYKKFRKNITQYRPMLKANLIPIVDALESHRDKVACFKGCSWCCYYRVVARTHEIIAIYTYINTELTESISSNIREEILATAKMVENMSDAKHIETNIKCPMLQNGRCSIYDVRPIKCAGYYSTSDHDCEQLYHNTKVSAGVPVMDILEKTGLQDDKVKAVIEYENHDTNEYELVTSLAALFKDPKLISRWRRNGKAIFTRLA